MINQLFRKYPDIDLLKDILNAFGLKYFDESIKFTYHRLDYYNTVEALTLLKPRIIDIYISCKSYYAIILNNKHAITFFRQICNLFNYKLKCTNITKDRTYSISKNKNNNIIKKNITLKFD